MKLKLAEYDLKSGKFLEFMEIGDTRAYSFIYGGRFVQVSSPPKRGNLARGDGSKRNYYRDETDPLNRFDGLFNGRTFGEGKFVLMKGEYKSVGSYDDNHKLVVWQDDVWLWEHCKKSALYLVKDCGNLDLDVHGDEAWKMRTDYEITENINILEDCRKAKRVGNLHEQPELYKKIK